MADFGIDFQIKKLFTDRPAVQRAVKSATVKTLGQIGGYVRKVARNSMPRVGRSGRGRIKIGRRLAKQGERLTAPAGKPPYAHAGQIKDLLYYGVEPDRNSVIVGPVRFKPKRVGGGLVPALMEFGGTETGKAGMRIYRPHPFIGPAGNKSQPKFADFFKSNG